MTQPTAASRAQLLLTIVAIAVGGGVFVLAGDFVIGVGVAAAVFAVGRQALTVWASPGDGQDRMASGPDHDKAGR